ncbi:SatD family protein [Clostridium rectalis]|uniref:SatD family protein n=1 Tax=Clostridium rectalis TaxID=2040295 RepID=UPI000F63FF4A|nr:SatD family protein [Clostridium rectalis]
MKIFGVINIDIMDSRNLTNRKFIQNELRNYINKLNIELKDILLCPITMTLGDEWQIVLKDISKSYRVIRIFQNFLYKYNIHIYAGIGVGSISTEVYNDSRLMDGECFIKAREALNTTKNKNRFYNKKLNSTKNNIYFNAKEIGFVNETKESFILPEVAVTSDLSMEKQLSVNKIINSFIENNEVIKSRVTNKQLEIIQLYERLGSYNNIVKNNKDTSKADISQKLNASNYFVINNNNLIIELLLNLYLNFRRYN